MKKDGKKFQYTLRYCRCRFQVISIVFQYKELDYKIHFFPPLRNIPGHKLKLLRKILTFLSICLNLAFLSDCHPMTHWIIIYSSFMHVLFTSPLFLSYWVSWWFLKQFPSQFWWADDPFKRKKRTVCFGDKRRGRPSEKIPFNNRKALKGIKWNTVWIVENYFSRAESCFKGHERKVSLQPWRVINVLLTYHRNHSASIIGLLM